MDKEYLELAHKVANKYKYLRPYCHDEILSSCYFGLTQGLKWIEEGRCTHNNKKAYLVVTMKRFVFQWFRKNSLPIDNGFFRLVSEGVTDDSKPRYVNNEDLIDLNLFAKEHQLTVLEYEIIQLIVKGFRTKEIALALKCSSANVSKALRNIRKKVLL